MTTTNFNGRAFRGEPLSYRRSPLKVRPNQRPITDNPRKIDSLSGTGDRVWLDRAGKLRLLFLFAVGRGFFNYGDMQSPPAADRH